MTPGLVELDRKHLLRTMELARAGEGRVSPNPLVGCVIAQGAEVIGEGFHAQLGSLHAERAALAACRERRRDPAGATAYVTLEPCAHTGRQPPCTDALLDAGIVRVIYASDDPSTKASGRGPALLRERGIEVIAADGEIEHAARLLNQPFRKHALTGRPHVTFKSAVSVDGRTSAADGDSRWISSQVSREAVHRMRARVDAVVVGIGTALADDPVLTARPPEREPHRQPLRIVFDSGARLPLASNLIAGVSEVPVLVVAGPDTDNDRVEALREAGADVLLTSSVEHPERVAEALDELGRREVTSVLLEGGAILAGAFLDCGEVDLMEVFVAPIVIGAKEAWPLAAGNGAQTMDAALRALSLSAASSGADIQLTARLKEW